MSNNRFTNIYHLVPFYNGNKKNVIPVYECSYYFQGYISQGLKSYFKEDYTHYFFISDDLLLNPIINEINYFEHFNLNPHSCFIPGFVNLHDRFNNLNDMEEYWPRVSDAFHWSINFRGVEAENQLPDYGKAIQKFQEFDLNIEPLRFNQIWKISYSFRDWIRFFIYRQLFSHIKLILRFIYSKLINKKYYLSYPIIGSYSDIFIISSDTIKEFCHYCGVFAATRLFVEVGLPTSLVLSAKEIITEKDLKFQGKALWTKEQYQELDKYDSSLKQLLKDFPKNYLYFHPIKLSKWNTEL